MKEPDNKTPYSASEYDRKVRQTLPFYETIHQETVDVVRTVKPDAARWLDTGCGTGHLVELALPFFPNTQFVLADPSQAMLQQARERLQKNGGARVKMLSPVGSEGLTSRMAGTKCQVVTAIQCHHYLLPPQREQAVRACFDALENDGLFIAFENITMSTRRGVEIGLERWARWQREAGRSPSAVDDHLKRFNTEYFPITLDEHLELLIAIGFQTVELFWLSQMQAGFYGIKPTSAG
jgi:tRNA (cmo5U34)-methyltransferase